MKFSEYRRLREREDQEQNTGTDAGALSATAIKQTTRRKFTDIMKEREPERYERMLAERKANSISEFTNRVNQHVTDINTQITDAADYINKNRDIYNLDADDNAERRHAEYEVSKQQTINLIKEANNNPYLDTKLREQAYDAFLNSLSSIQKADKANNAYSDYMKQFDNKEAFERTRAAERKQEELNSLSAEELQQRILDAENNLDAVKEQDKVSTKTMGFKALQEHMQTQNANKKQLENDIQCYKNELFSRQQSEALEKLSDETKAAFEEFYVLQNEGYNKDASGFEKVLDNLSGGSHVVVQRAYEDQAKEKAILELEKQGISKEEFESLYEYYKFARDKEENTTKVKEWNQEYDNAGVVGKIGLNAATIATAPVKGVTALQETVDSLHYKNPYAPLNINSDNYEFTNYTDTVRNATSQDIKNDKLNFLYQTGMSMADMATFLPLSSVSGGTSLALMGTNAGTSAAKEATLRGASKEQALMTGLAAGGAEVVFEKLSLDHFWDIARHQGKAATRSAFINILAQAGIEGTEEVFTDLANTFADELINKGLSEWYQNMDSYYKQGMSMTEAQKAATADYCKQLGSSFLGGFLSGGAFGTGGVVNTSLAGKKSTMTADDYMQIAEGIDTERNSYMSQADYDTAMGVQQLAQALSKKENVTDFEKGLFEQESSRMENINWFNNPKEQIRQISERMPNETVSRAFIADYKDGMPVDTYARAFDMFYKAGYNELTFEQALSTSDAFEAVIGKPTLYAIHSLGMNQAAEASKTFTNTEQKELVNTMAKALGVTVQYQDIPGANGMYKDGMIYISNNTINPSMVVMSHELTHHLKANVTEEYATYENYVIDYFKEFHTKEYDSLYKAMTEQYGNDDALIREEIAANAAETFLTDSEAVNRFVKQNRTIAEKIADFLDNFITKLKELYQGYKAQGKAGKMLAEDIEVYEKARDLWYEAVNAGQENKITEGEQPVRFSIKRTNEGISFVEIDIEQEAFQGKTPEECARIAKKTILEKFSGTIIGEKEGTPIVATKRTAKEYSYASKNYNKATAKAKMKASPELNNLLEVSTYIKHSDEVGKHDEAVGGFDYYKTIFRVNGRNFEGIINIMNTKNVRLLYDITKIKELGENEFPTKNSSPASSTQPYINNILQNEQNDNQKFSLKAPIEETKDLIALHNLTSDKFMKTLDLGGFPMPSIAITNTEIGHTNFGDISCVFYKDTIDPANKKNKVFGADAWTPTFPRIEYEADLDIAREIYHTVSEYAQKLPDEYQNKARGFVSGLEYSINSWGGYKGIIEEALKNTSMKAVYLVSKGENVEEIQKTTVTEMEEVQKETCKKLLDAYGSKVDVLSGNETGKEIYDAFGEQTKEVLMQNAISRGATADEARNMVDNLTKMKIVSSIRNALKYRKNKGIETITVVDTESMKQDIENRVDMKAYEEWLKGLFNGIEKDSGLWNGKELYTASGNARSFKQTHIPFNVQNIVEAMLKQSEDVRNVAGFNGTKTIRAVATEDFKSIDEIKEAAKTKLKNIDTDEYNKLRDELDDRLYKVMSDIVSAKKSSGNSLIEMDTVGNIIVEACKNPTAENFKNTLQKYNHVCTEEQANEIADVVNTVANMPVNMFEAKPLRVVDFSEVAAVIVPRGTEDELIQKIQDNGMRIIEYTAGNENERKDILNSIQGVKFSRKFYEDELGLRFSDKDCGDLFESILMGTDNVDYQSVLVDDGSESYRATMDLINESARILQDGIAAAGKLKDFNVTRDMAQAMAAHYLNKYSATFNEDTLTNNLFNIFAYMQNTEDVNYQDMIRLMQEVCKPVIATSQKIDKELMKQYNEFRKFVRSYHIKLNEEQKAEIANVYDSFRTFKNMNQNKYTFRENGSYLDSVWSQLVEASGYALSYDTQSSEQMLALHDYMITLEKSITSPAEDMDNSQVAYDMALNIYTDYFKLIGENKQAIKNLRTQMQKKLNEYKRDVREDYKDRFKKYKEETNIKTQDEINRLQKQIRQLERERDDALHTADDITVNILDGDINALEYTIGKLSQRNADKLAKLTAQSYNRSVQIAITRQQTEIKNHIKKNMFDLQNRLAKPKENKFIPQGLVRATIDLCEAVNIDTGKSQRLAERLDEMSHLYARMKDDKDYALSSEYDEQTQAAINRLREVFSGRNITMLNMMELKEVDSLITQLRFQIVNASKLIGMEKSREVYKTAIKCMNEIKAVKSYNPDSRVSRGLNKYNSMMLNPKRQFRRMSGYKDDSVLNQIYEDLNNGQQKQMQVLMETARIFDTVTKGNHNQKCINALVGKEKKDWIDIGLNYKNMEPVMVPRAFRVSLAMHLQNKANLDHIIYGGLTIPEPKAYQRGDYATAYATGTTVHFIPAEADTEEKRQQAYHDAVNKLKSVVAQMTPYEKAMVKCAETFFHEYTGEKINETSLQLNGYKKARVHNYFPIRTDSNFRQTEIEGLIRNAAIENMGMLNTRVGARNPILLEDITKVIQRQSENVAKYYGLAIPIRNFNKIYNTTKIGYQDSTKSVIARKWGVTGQKYIEDLITDLQTKRGGESTILDTLQGNFAQSVLSGNLSVAAQQVVAYPTAAATLGWDAVVKGMKYIPTKLDMEHIAKYTPLLWYRNQGTGTQEIGDVHKSKDLMSALASKATTALEHHNMEHLAWISRKGEQAINWEMELLQRIDTKAVGSLWKASEIYVRNTKKITPEQGEDAFYREVAKVFNNCIDDTQANYSTMQRPDILRNPGKAWKMIFLFKTQPLQNFGIMYDAFGNLRAKAEAYKNSTHLDEKGKSAAELDYIRAKKEFSRAITSQLAAATGVFAMKFIANVITYRMDRYRNKEDEITGWKIVEELLNEVISNMAGSVLGGSEVYNFINSIFTDNKYYGVGIGVIDSFNDFTNSLLKMIEEPEWDNLKQLYFDAGVLVGVPGENMYKFVSGISKHWTDMTDGKDGYFNVGHETKLSVQYTTMMNALVEGDAEKYEKRYADTLESLRLTKDEDDAKAAITSGIKTKLREYYLESEITYEDAIMILEKLGDKEPYFTVKKWDNADNKEYNKYSELETAVNNGQGIDEEIEELIDNGVREENVNMKLMNIVKEGYIHGDISKERASQYLKQYKDDYTDEDVYWKLREWDKSGSYEDGEKYSKYDDLINAVESANFESVVKEYVEHGTDASTIKQQISEKYRPIYQEAYLKADYKTLQKIKDILNKLRVNGKRIYTPDDYVGWNKQAKKKEKEKKE